MQRFASALENFDERSYLKVNADVAAAVQRGEFASGLEHYVAYGLVEGRGGVEPEVQASIWELMNRGAQLPAPPERLRERVHGDANLESFEGLGRRIAYNLYRALRPEFKATDSLRVLDFGCGCGRVIRYFSPLMEGSELYAVDVDHEAIDWCKRHLGAIGEFSKNNAEPPMSFERGSFDMVYSISVMTHLPEDMQLLWLAEIERVLKPGGLALVSTHGAEVLKARSKRKWKQLLSEGFLYMAGEGVDGLPEYYQNAFHTHEYIRNVWSKYFEVETIIERGVAGHQDLVVCRKSS